MSSYKYMTAGQFARKTGVTVRTLQYYDQQGLLKPSAKGPRNQRLYSNADADILYKILTLKYLGLSLSKIRECINSSEEVDVFQSLLLESQQSYQSELNDLIKRLSTLETIVDYVEHPTLATDRYDDRPSINWEHLVDVIEEGQNDLQYFWRFGSLDATGDIPTHKCDSDLRAVSVAHWHELIADTLSMMSMQIEPSDPRTKDLALRYQQLDGAGGLEQGFWLMENVAPQAPGEIDGSFETLQKSVGQYLEQVEAAHSNNE